MGNSCLFLEFESLSLELFGYDLRFGDLRFKPYLLVTTEKPAASMYTFSDALDSGMLPKP